MCFVTHYRCRSQRSPEQNRTDGLCLTLVSMSLTSLMLLHNQQPSLLLPPHNTTTIAAPPPHHPQLVCLSFSAGGLQFQSYVGVVCVCESVCIRAVSEHSRVCVCVCVAFRLLPGCANVIIEYSKFCLQLCHHARQHERTRTDTDTNITQFVSE